MQPAPSQYRSKNVPPGNPVSRPACACILLFVFLFKLACACPLILVLLSTWRIPVHCFSHFSLLRVCLSLTSFLCFRSECICPLIFCDASVLHLFAGHLFHLSGYCVCNFFHVVICKLVVRTEFDLLLAQSTLHLEGVASLKIEKEEWQLPVKE